MHGRVGEEVVQHLTDPVRVEPQPDRGRARQNGQRVAVTAGPERVGRLPDRVHQIGVRHPQRGGVHLGRVQPREQQQIVEEEPRPGGLGAQPGQMPLPLLGRVGGRVLDGDTITAVRLLEQPDHPQTAAAVPRLIASTLEAQSADIDTVSGATVTSDGYRESLQAAIDARGA
ncbi:FMN-binding protein [Streptomyces antibioticus]|uniref:FMN-binding protein n=1 Tax=Streptomyces antibioticus TaxID=1890 RepID=UPI0036BB0886